MRSIIFEMLIVMAAAGCTGSGNSNTSEPTPSNLQFDTTVSAGTFSVETQYIAKDTAKGIDGGYGYSVSVNGKKIINQTCIPVVEGVNRFSSADDALNTGKMVINKMIHAAGLPSLTKEDLIELGVLKSDGTLNKTK